MLSVNCKSKISIVKPFWRCVLTLVFSCHFSFGQEFADTKFYLVDSLILSDISEDDRLLIDTSLQHFHQSAHDTTALEFVEHIVDECWNEDVWPKYNQYIFIEAGKLIRKTNNPVEIRKYASLLAGAISNLGYIADNEGNIPGALNYYHNSLQIYERINDLRGCATAFNNLGVLYNSQGDTSKALYYHTESLNLKKKLGDERGMALSLNNVGTIYKDQGRHFEALDCFEKSLRISKALNDERVMAIAYDNIAGIYFKEGYPSKAIDYYSKALEIREINGEYSGAAFSLNNIASVYMSMGQYQQAENFALESMAVAEQSGWPQDIMNASETLYQLYKRKNRFDLSLSYHELFIQMRDSIHNLNNERELLSQGLKYQYEKEALKDSLENQKIQELKDLHINEQNAVINQEKTVRYALVIGLLLMIYLAYISVRNYRRKQKDNELIQKQKSEVENQKQKIEKQHHILEATYKEISDSITYAKRIQQAILPPLENISSEFTDSFVWYLPKNVVSGDFYWKEKINDVIVLAVADCTGHGVPGAMVSVVCHNALNRAVFEFGLIDPAQILDKTRELVIETFDKSGSEVKDGMDISLVCIDLKKSVLRYAGANNNIYLIRESLVSELNNVKAEISMHDEQLCTLIEFKSDKQPIGRFSKSKPFSQTEFEIEKHDKLFLFSDGLADQFGGPKGKKFKYQQFKEILVKNHNLNMGEQMQILTRAFENWKGELEQVDDVCVIGFKI